MAAAGRLDLVVVRHGLTSWNRERRYQGHRDIALLLPDALPALDALRESLHGLMFDAAYCSDLGRCRQTLAHVMEGRGQVPSYVDRRLRELDFGDYEGKTWDELKDLPAYRAWIDSRGAQAPPGGESSAVLAARLDTWLQERLAALDPCRRHRLLVVTHGGVIREWRRRFEAIDFWEGSVGQAQGRQFSFVYRDGTWQCNSSSAVPAPASELP